MGNQFDVFLSYSSSDRPEVLTVNRFLKEILGFQTWLDEEQILPGEQFLPRLAEGLNQSQSCAVFVGRSGTGPWENREFNAALARQVTEPSFRVIPVLLGVAPGVPELPAFLAGNSWVDLRSNTVDGLRRLALGIRGARSLISMAPPPVFQVAGTTFKEGLPTGFSADVEKIVSLLIGDSLYSRQDVFVRELIQNSIDACERRRVSVLQYFPAIEVQVNTTEGWFQVSDNGDGMNAKRLRERFSVIGRSILDESDLLQRTVSTSADRLFLIAKFGIGFISSFIVAKRIFISTTAENSKQINFAVAGINSQFEYSEKSLCGREARAIGTTVRVVLRKEFLEGPLQIHPAVAVSSYVRHAPHVALVIDDAPSPRKETWNVSDCILVRTTRHSGLLELTCGVAPKPDELSALEKLLALREGNENPETRSEAESHFTISSGGFFVNHEPNNLVPFYTPRWIVGEVNFWPGAVDLNLARDSVMTNIKSEAAKARIREAIRSLLVEYISTQKEAAEPDDYPRIRDLAMLCYSATLGKDTEQLLREPPLLTAEESREFILDTFLVEHGLEGKRKTLRMVIEQLKESHCRDAYAYWVTNRYPALKLVIKFLRTKNRLVFEYHDRHVEVYGTRGETRRVSEFEVLTAVLGSDGIKLRRLDDLPPDSIDGLAYDVSKLPANVRFELEQLAVPTKLTFINLPSADLSFRLGETLYLNAANPSFAGLTNRFEELPRTLIRAYLLGVTQQSIETLTAGPSKEPRSS